MRPTRSSVAASQMTARSGASSGRRTDVVGAERNPNAGGKPSALTISVSAPSRSAIRLTATAAPMVSASGFSWQIAVMRRASRMACATRATSVACFAARVKRTSGW